MLRLILAGIAGFLAVANRGNEPITLYWTLVCIYWISNYMQSFRGSRDP